MREILFRGKRIDNGEWIEGVPIQTHIGTFIVFEENPHYCGQYGYMEICELAKVDHATVGQYTGLTDKNGKRIFEGDIVAQNWYDHDEPSDDSFGEVVFCEYDCSFSVLDVEKDGIVPFGRCGAYHWEAEVIGNIHDNPELLNGGDAECP